ncbi:MAG: HAD family phosphatase [Oscillospiraceae bacterium]|nr:HAD family phosphatase [Oscillospiraceae bacterium]
MKGAIFDMDGLLFDTERLFQRVWHEMAAERGLTLDGGFALAVCGTTGAAEEAVVRRYFPGAEPAAVIEELNRRTRALEQTEVPLKPGVHTILEGMREGGWRIAVASSSPPDMIRHNLSLTGLRDFFDELVSGNEAARGKPFPDIFLLAARRLGLPAADCWVFEDSVNGVRAGIAAGCKTVMVPDLVPPLPEFYAQCAGVWPDLAAAWEQIAANV